MTDNTPNIADVFRALARKGWGDHTILTICATDCDDQGNFEVAVFDEDDLREPVFEPARCNVNDHMAELDQVMNAVIDVYQEWQAERASKASTKGHPQYEWKTGTQ